MILEGIKNERDMESGKGAPAESELTVVTSRMKLGSVCFPTTEVERRPLKDLTSQKNTRQRKVEENYVRGTSCLEVVGVDVRRLVGQLGPLIARTRQSPRTTYRLPLSNTSVHLYSPRRYALGATTV